MITEKIKLYNGYYNLNKLIIRKKSGKKTSREFLKNKDGVAAIVYDKNLDKYIFVSQWRPCLENYMTEIVAGSIEMNETPEQAIEKEILEEIGYKCDSIKYLTKCYVSPGVLSELIHVFYVEVSEKIADGGGLESELEEIDIVYMTKSEMLSSEFIDAKTLLAINMIKL